MNSFAAWRQNRVIGPLRFGNVGPIQCSGLTLLNCAKFSAVCNLAKMITRLTAVHYNKSIITNENDRRV